MRQSFLTAAIACSLLLHVLVLNLEWYPAVARAGVVVPWREALSLHVNLAAVSVPARPAAAERRPAPLPAAPPRPQKRRETEPVQGLASANRTAPAPSEPALATVAPQVPAPAPSAVPEALPQAPTHASADGGLPDSSFAEAGGVDEVARPLSEPQFSLPGRSAAVVGWKVEFDLLIDSEGKVVRVDNVVASAPGELVGAVLAAFYVLRFEPAKLAGQPVAIRQRFEVKP